MAVAGCTAALLRAAGGRYPHGPGGWGSCRPAELSAGLAWQLAARRLTARRAAGGDDRDQSLPISTRATRLCGWTLVCRAEAEANATSPAERTTG